MCRWKSSRNLDECKIHILYACVAIPRKIKPVWSAALHRPITQSSSMMKCIDELTFSLLAAESEGEHHHRLLSSVDGGKRVVLDG